MKRRSRAGLPKIIILSVRCLEAVDDRINHRWEKREKTKTRVHYSRSMISSKIWIMKTTQIKKKRKMRHLEMVLSPPKPLIKLLFHL